MRCPKTVKLIGNAVPVWFPRGTAVGNRILKPIYNFFSKDKFQTVSIWNGINLYVNPSDCIGGNLYFSPQLYEIEERQAIEDFLPLDGVFVDIGANIGAYTLWAASLMNSKGRILAIEADPKNHELLKKNISLNSLDPSIITENVGVSDREEILPFFRNSQSNAGANSFFESSDGEVYKELQLLPLTDLLQKHDVGRIDFLKIDIEGFEFKVLSGFFDEIRKQNKPQLLPKYVLVEINEGPRAKEEDYTCSLRELFSRNAYEVITDSKNTLFKKRLSE